jgi:hypothetical protein
MSVLPAYIVLCGMPRCGTRQFSDFINRDERVCLQAEIHKPLVESVHTLVTHADKVYGAGKKSKLYTEKRCIIVPELFGYISKVSKNTKETAVIHGFKTPGIEECHQQLSELLLPSTQKLVYLYSIRNIKDCYLSISSMSWFKSTQKRFIGKYISSLRDAIALHKSAQKKGSKIQVSALNLDDYIASNDKPAWINERLYRPVGIDISHERAAELIKTTKNTNATARITGKERPTELSLPMHLMFMANQRRINNAVRDFNATFGENLALYE